MRNPNEDVDTYTLSEISDKFNRDIYCKLNKKFVVDENVPLSSKQYRAWSDCMDVLAALALYWWQTLKNHLILPCNLQIIIS